MRKGIAKIFLRIVPIVIILLFYMSVISSNLLPSGLSFQGFTTIVIFLISIYLWATELIPLPVTAFLAMLMLAFSGSVSIANSLYGLGSTVEA